jgi:hypothetical protein
MYFEEEILDERTLMKGKKIKKSGTMDIPGSEGAARRDVSRAGFRKRGPIQDPKVEKSGKDVPVWVRTHSSPRDYAAHTARKQHREGDKPQSRELRKQFGKTGAKKDSPVHDITVGSPKSKVRDPGQRARQFVGALKDVKNKMKSKKGVATNTPTAIDSAKSKGKKNRSGEEGAEQRGRIYKKLGMGERNPKTGVQMAKLNDSFGKKTFGEFIYECYVVMEAKKYTRTRSREDAEKIRQSKPNPKDYRLNNAQTTDMPFWRLVLKAKRDNQSTRRKERINSVSSPEHMASGKAKEEKLKKAGLDAHHITPIHYSAKLKKSMTDDEWKKRVERDAADGIYHGHHPKNLMGTVNKNTPEERRRRGIHHRKAGAHELEAKTKDLSHVGHKGLLSMAHKRRLRKEKEERADQIARMDVSGRANNLPERG